MNAPDNVNGDLCPVLVTGATGYVGGRLVPSLLSEGYRVRAASRSLDKLRSRAWSSHPNMECVALDMMDADSVRRAAQDCRTAYYLVHSMNPGEKNFHEADMKAARNMVRAAEEEGLRRIIYLGGLGEDNPSLSKHLRSRKEVGEALKLGRVPVTILRAAMIIGAGSASFEILRYLVDRLPVMVTPRWVKTPCQPIAIRNVITYLTGCLREARTTGETFDIGGADVLTYRELMRIYAEEAGLGKRLIFSVPVLTPRLSSYWIHLVTPVPASIARPLAEGLSNPVICRDERIKDLIPQKLLSVREAIAGALGFLRDGQILTHWTDAGALPPVEWSFKGDPRWAGGTLFEERRQAEVSLPPEKIWPYISRIGGKNGWYHANYLWIFRGVLDRLVGGVGLRRGRRDPAALRPGDALDFWRVVEVKKRERLLLVAEMRLPGQATLEFAVEPKSKSISLITQTARFKPRGLFGLLYWYLVYPLHAYVFAGMLRAMVRCALAEEEKLNNTFRMSTATQI